MLALTRCWYSLLLLAGVTIAQAANPPLPEGAVARLGVRPYQHPSAIRAIIYHPDGNTMLTVSGNSLYLWKSATKELIRSVKVHANTVNAMALSADGKWVAFNVGTTETGLIWDVELNKEVCRLEAVKNPRSFAFVDADKTVVAHGEGSLHAWDVRSGKQSKFTTEPPPGVIGLTTSGDGKTHALITKDATILWDRQKGREIARPDYRRERQSEPVLFAPDGKTLLTVSNQRHEVQIWDAVTGKLVERKTFNSEAITTAVVVPNGKSILLAGSQEIVEKLHLLGGKNSQFSLGESSELRHLVMSRDGKRLATTSSDGRTLLIVDAATGLALENNRGHPGGVAQLAVSADGKYLVSGIDFTQIEDGMPRIWDLATLRSLPELDRNRGYPSTFSIAPDGTLAIANFEVSIRRWKLGDTKEQKAFSVRPDDSPMALAYSPDGAILAVGYESGIIEFLDASSGKVLPRTTMKIQQSLHRLLWSPDGRFLAVSNMNHATVYLFHAASGRQVRTFSHSLLAKRGQVFITFSPDGRTLALTDRRSLVLLYETATGELRLSIPGITVARSLAFTPDGRTLLVSSGNNMIRFIDTATGLERHRLAAANAGVDSLVLLPDGRRLASGCGDGSILIWDVASKIAPSRQRSFLTAREETSLIRMLREGDSEQTWSVINRLAEAEPDVAVRLLKTELQPVSPLDETMVRRWIADLDSNVFRVRDRAEKELEKLGSMARTELRTALIAKPTDEMMQRLERLLRRINDDIPPANQIFILRAVETLERNGSRGACAELERLAGGAPDAFLTIEAQRSWERMNCNKLMP